MSSRFLPQSLPALAATLLTLGLLSTPTLARPDIEVTKSVDTPLPTPGQPVEFTIRARNVGDAVASSVTVVDRLPPEMRIPPGMAAWVSAGAFDASTNTWTLPTLSPGVTQTLVLPAAVVASNPPQCLANVAESSNAADTNSSNNRAVAAVRQSATDRCVDVAVSFEPVEVQICGAKKRSVKFEVSVRNLGPDDARNVYLDLSQESTVIPGLRFVSPTCSGTRCTFATLARGAVMKLDVRSSEFENKVQKTVMLNLSASSSDVDYSTANNQEATAYVIPRFESCEDVLYKDSACFIATAAYGSPLDPHVRILREFRYRYLAHTAAGRAFIGFYYRHSPPMASFIAAHPTLRVATRLVLTPVVLAIVYPLRALVCLMLALLMLVTWRRRARIRTPL